MNVVKLKLDNDTMVSLSVLCSISGASIENFCEAAIREWISDHSEFINSHKEVADKIRSMLPTQVHTGGSEFLDAYAPSDAESGVLLTRDVLLPYFPNMRPYKLKQRMSQLGFIQTVAKVGGVAKRGYWALKKQPTAVEIQSFI